jgi:rRNA maturation endonuclease Nob1
MPYFQCHDCFKITHIDADLRKACPVCGSQNGEILSDEEHHKAVEEGQIFHDDTD